MKNIFILFLVLFAFTNIVFAEQVTFNFSAKYEIKDGQIEKTSGKSKQTFEIKNNKIYLLSATQTDFEWKGKDEFLTDLVSTLSKKDYYIGYYSNGIHHEIIQINKDLKDATIYSWNGLDNHCTIWYGKNN